MVPWVTPHLPPSCTQAVICDESHCLKTRTTKRTQFATALVKSARRALLITGTPLLSKPIELFPQVGGGRE